MALLENVAGIGKVRYSSDVSLVADDGLGEFALESKILSVRSPLRYPGGKTRAIQVLLQNLPTDVSEVCSPFLGGGSFELAMASRGIKVHGYDIFSPLVNFWQKLLHSPKKLADSVSPHFPLAKQDFYDLQKNYFKIKNKTKQAAAFYALNRASFSGTTLSGGMSPGHPRFTNNSINNLRNFKIRNFAVGCADFQASIAQHESAFLYCDPPYINGESLYGHRGDTHKGFNHSGLYDVLANRERWILSYNDCAKVRSLYAGYEIIKPQWVYGMGNSKLAGEVLIFSHDLH